jgi:hypothetical protein
MSKDTVSIMGSLGNFNLQFTLQVENNSDDAIVPEICLVTMQSGILVSERGQTSVNNCGCVFNKEHAYQSFCREVRLTVCSTILC